MFKTGASRRKRVIMKTKQIVPEEPVLGLPNNPREEIENTP
jgi:hypothetical protein